MSAAGDLKNSLKSALAAALPGRIVTRSYHPISLHDDADLEQGVITITGLGEGKFANTLGREAQLGTLRLAILVQLKVPDDSTGYAVESLEDTVAEEIKNFIFNRPSELAGLELKQIQQSGQLEHPYGWIAIEMELLT